MVVGGGTCQQLEVAGTLVQQVRLKVEGRGLSGIDDLYVSCGNRRDTLTAAVKAATAFAAAAAAVAGLWL